MTERPDDEAKKLRMDIVGAEYDILPCVHPGLGLVFGSYRGVLVHSSCQGLVRSPQSFLIDRLFMVRPTQQLCSRQLSPHPPSVPGSAQLKLESHRDDSPGGEG